MQKFSAQQLIDELFRINRRLAEEVLDTISNNAEFETSGTWDRDDDGNMILLTYKEAERLHGGEEECPSCNSVMEKMPCCGTPICPQQDAVVCDCPVS